MLGDKEITVRIRSNSHYRISLYGSSRNAYRSAHVKVSWATWGDAVMIGEGVFALTVFWYGRIPKVTISTPTEGTFILSFFKKQKGYIKMKKTVKASISIVLSLVFIVCLVSCNTVKKSGLWEDATYRKDMEFGDGAKTVVVEVKAEDQMVTFTVNTDKETVGEALLEHELIAGDEGQYGLYVKTVNGITADYDVDQSYWAFYVDGEYAMTGVDMTEIDEDVTYQLAYTK